MHIFYSSLMKTTFIRINKIVTPTLCDKRLGACEKVIALGSNFDPNGSCNGKYEFINENEIICTLDAFEKFDIEEAEVIVKTSTGQQDSINITIFDSRLEFV